MKKLLLFLSVFALFFTLTACEDTDLLDQVATIDATIVSIEADITDVEADITSLQADVTSTEGDVTTLTTDLGNLDVDITAVETDVTAIETDVTNLDTDVGAINDALVLIEADILSLEGAVADNDTLILALQTAVSALETALAALDSRVIALETAVLMLQEMEVSVDAWKDLVNDKIVLMYNNDVHGRVNDDGWAGSVGYARIKNVIDEIRNNYDYTYLVSAGDMFHGTTFATLEEGESFVQVMNAVGYDLMVPGNHDFDYGQDQLLVLEGLADFPLISSNIQYAVDDTDMFEPYYIETFGDVKVGFFGLTTPDTTYMTHPDNVIGINFLDPEIQAAAMVAALEDEGADIIVMLAHIGLDESSSVTTEDIAENVDGIDVIIDGHSHSYLPTGFMVNDTVIVSTGEYNKNFGVLELTIEDDEILSYNNLLLNDDEITLLDLGSNQAIQDAIDAIIDLQDVILSVVVGQTAVELDGVRDNVRTGETNLGMIITDSMIDVTGADVAITNGGGIRASIAAGPVTRGDVITVLPFGNIIVTVDLTGQELYDTLLFGVSELPGSDGSFPHVSGITYTVTLHPDNLGEPVAPTIGNVMVNGVALDLLATYSVATNDFMAAGGDGYVILGAATITGEYMGLHEAFESMFEVGVDITIPTDTRLTVIPVPE